MSVFTTVDCAHECMAYDEQQCKAFNFKTRSMKKEVNCQLTNTTEHGFRRSGKDGSWMFYQAELGRQVRNDFTFYVRCHPISHFCAIMLRGSDVAFLSFMQQLSGYSYILILLFFKLCFGNTYFVAMATHAYEMHSKISYHCEWMEKKQFFEPPIFKSVFSLRSTLTMDKKRKKQSVMPFFL